MKRIMTTLAVMLLMAASAAAMSLSKARNEALFLSDKMAYELNLSLSQYEAVYEINLDYMLTLYDVADVSGVHWMRRNADLRYVLTAWQWDRYTAIPDFYRPMSWVRGHRFELVLRTRYIYSDHYYYDRPSIYKSYRGGHNTGTTSYYANREFHRPAANNAAPQHYGSSAPPAYGSGSTRGKRNTQPSYHHAPEQNNSASHLNNGRSTQSTATQRSNADCQGTATQRTGTGLQRSTSNSSRSTRGASTTDR